MTQTNSATPRNLRGQLLVYWVIWGALTASIFIYQMTLGGGIPLGRNPYPAQWNFVSTLVAAWLAVSVLIRWIVIPRISSPKALLMWMVAGMAANESIVFFEIFLGPREQTATRLCYFLACLAGAIQYVPVYAAPKLSAVT